MKILPIILIISCFLISASAQVRNHIYIKSSNWMDGIGTVDVIAFEQDDIYRQYKWEPNSQKLQIKNSGSYNVANDTVFCVPLSRDEARFELIVSRENKQNVLLRNGKAYNMDGTLSEIRIHGPSLKELDCKQYHLLKKARKTN